MSDRSNSELMNIIVRYVTTFGFIREAVVGLIKADSTAAANLCSVVDARLKELPLLVNDIVGQCYGGASNMSGHTSGLQARLKDLSIRKPILSTVGRMFLIWCCWTFASRYPPAHVLSNFCTVSTLLLKAHPSITENT